jgi:hypothetical protein
VDQTLSESKFKAYHESLFSHSHHFTQPENERDWKCKTCLIDSKYYKKKLQMYTLIHPTFMNRNVNYIQDKKAFKTNSSVVMHAFNFNSYEICFLNDNDPKDESIINLNL